MAKTIHTDKAPKAIGPYVQGKIVGNLLFASGQVPLSPETGEIVGETIQEQTEQVLKTLELFWQKQEQIFDHVVKTTCFLSDMNDFVPFNEVYQTAFNKEFPARSAVEVARLPRDVKVEMKSSLRLDKRVEVWFFQTSFDIRRL